MYAGVIQIGLARSVRLGQGSQVQITCKRPMNLQVDGEPWALKEPSVVNIDHLNQALMLRPSEANNASHRSIAEITAVLDMAEASQVISPAQRLALLREFANREIGGAPHGSHGSGRSGGIRSNRVNRGSSVHVNTSMDETL